MSCVGVGAAHASSRVSTVALSRPYRSFHSNQLIQTKARSAATTRGLCRGVIAEDQFAQIPDDLYPDCALPPHLPRPRKPPASRQRVNSNPAVADTGSSPSAATAGVRCRRPARPRPEATGVVTSVRKGREGALPVPGLQDGPEACSARPAARFITVMLERCEGAATLAVSARTRKSDVAVPARRAGGVVLVEVAWDLRR